MKLWESKTSAVDDVGSSQLGSLSKAKEDFPRQSKHPGAGKGAPRVRSAPRVAMPLSLHHDSRQVPKSIELAPVDTSASTTLSRSKGFSSRSPSMPVPQTSRSHCTIASSLGENSTTRIKEKPARERVARRAESAALRGPRTAQHAAVSRAGRRAGRRQVSPPQDISVIPEVAHTRLALG